MKKSFIIICMFLASGAVAYATQYQWEVPMLPVPGTGQLPDVTVEGVVSYIYSLGLALGGFFAFIRLVQAGIEWGEAGGNVGSVKEAQDIMKNVAFGLLLLLGAYALLNTINPEIVSPDISFPNNSQSAAQSRTTAATLGGTGNNSVGSSITKLLQSVDIGNVLPDTWTQVQQKLITVQAVERKTLSGGGGVVPPTAGCANVPLTPPAASHPISGNGYTFPVDGDAGYSCTHWGTAPRAADMWAFTKPNMPVLAYKGGIVESAYYDDYGGNAIIITGTDNRTYYYAHNCIAYVKKGDTVQTGQVIGIVGDTGVNAQGKDPHLHLAINTTHGTNFTIQSGNGPGGGDICPAKDFGEKFGSAYQATRCSKNKWPNIPNKWCCGEACPWD